MNNWSTNGWRLGEREGRKKKRWQETENWVDSPQRTWAGVDFTLAMTHSRGRCCHGAEGEWRRVKNGPDVRVHRDKRPYGPWGTNKVPVTKGALCSPAAFNSNLSGNSVLQSLSPLRSLSLSPSPAQECAFCKPTLSRGVSSHLVSYYCKGWCEEGCSIAYVQCKHMCRSDVCRWSSATLHSFNAWDNREQHSRKPNDPLWHEGYSWCQIFFRWLLHQSPRDFLNIKRDLQLSRCAYM